MFRTIPSILFVVAMIGLSPLEVLAQAQLQNVSSSTATPDTSFERKKFTVNRYKGRVLIDGREVSRLVPDDKSQELKLIEYFDGLHFSTDRQFQEWAQKLRGTRTYTYDEVKQIDDAGKETTKPLVLFDAEQRVELDKLWNVWLAKRQAEQQEVNRLRTAKEQDTAKYQQESKLLELQNKAIVAQAAAAERAADALDIISGATSLWEVELFPSESSGVCFTCTPNVGGFSTGVQLSGVSVFTGGSHGYSSMFGTSYNPAFVTNSKIVRAYGRTSKMATESAVLSHPGYRVGSVRKIAGY